MQNSVRVDQNAIQQNVLAAKQHLVGWVQDDNASGSNTPGVNQGCSRFHSHLLPTDARLRQNLLQAHCGLAGGGDQ